MNHKQALKASKCNPARVMKVLEELTEKKCPKCNGRGKFKPVFPGESGYGCGHCRSTGKVHYSHTPQVGEWCVWRKGIVMIEKVYDDDSFRTNNQIAKTKDSIPILEWEEIERVLEKAGYWLEEPIRREYGSEGTKCHCVIKKRGYIKPLGIAWGDTRKKAVDLAVIELGKELK